VAGLLLWVGRRLRLGGGRVFALYGAACPGIDDQHEGLPARLQEGGLAVPPGR
jgi:hypothetical protein